MRNSIIIVILLILVFSVSVLIKRMTVVKNPSSCLSQRNKLLALEPKPKNLFIPQCTLYGNYYQQQCNSSENTCWCVNSAGDKISGTLVEGAEPQACVLNWFVRVFHRFQR